MHVLLPGHVQIWQGSGAGQAAGSSGGRGRGSPCARGRGRRQRPQQTSGHRGAACARSRDRSRPGGASVLAQPPAPGWGAAGPGNRANLGRPPNHHALRSRRGARPLPCPLAPPARRRLLPSCAFSPASRLRQPRAPQQRLRSLIAWPTRHPSCWLPPACPATTQLLPVGTLSGGGPRAPVPVRGCPACKREPPWLCVRCRAGAQGPPAACPPTACLRHESADSGMARGAFAWRLISWRRRERSTRLQP